MSKKNRTQDRTQKQAPQKPLTLADLTVTWKDDFGEHQVTGEQLTLALEYAWVRTNDGKGSWKYCLADAEEAAYRMKNTGLLFTYLAGLETAEVTLTPEVFAAFGAIIEDARILLATSRNRKVPQEYRVKINSAEQPTPAAAGGER
jgi:hypothetical protein